MMFLNKFKNILKGMSMNRNTLIKLLCALTAIVVIVTSLSRLLGGNSTSLLDYAKDNPEARQTREESSEGTSVQETSSDTAEGTETPPAVSGNDMASGGSSAASPDSPDAAADLIGASLNGDSMLSERVTYNDSFYYEPLSDHLRRYITGVTYPKTDEPLEITYDDLSYLRIRHYNFEGAVTEGELICNKEIAQDLVEIFYELYQNQYQIEKVRLIDEYEGDDTASMEDNNTSCFNYRLVDGTGSLSKHAYGRAIDINPYYNPYVTYSKTGETKVSPAEAVLYADRTQNFPYKIDETDLCFKLFKEHGFTWGGNWNSSKDYQHFQKIE